MRSSTLYLREPQRRGSPQWKLVMSRAKRGRPVVAGEHYRQASGARRAIRAPRMSYRRFAELEQTVGLDPRLTSQIGRLRYLKLITDAQVAAADKVGQIYGRFERTIGCDAFR